MNEVPLYTAIGAGLISFLSPCVLPLVPPYLCYMAGASIDTLTVEDKETVDSEARAARRKAFGYALLFVLGFTVVFVSLGAGASTVGRFMRSQMDVLSVIAGIIVIIMGLHFLGVFKIGMLYREARFQTQAGGMVGAFLMGIAFAFGWTPCIGPVLGVILAMASARESIGEGATLLAFYSAGLGIPFLLAALFVGPFMRFLERFKFHLERVEKATGALLVVTGILFLTGGMQAASFWLLETFPSLGTLG